MGCSSNGACAKTVPGKYLALLTDFLPLIRLVSEILCPANASSRSLSGLRCQI